MIQKKSSKRSWMISTKSKVDALTYFSDWCARHAGDHISWFDENKLKELLETTGFQRVRITKPRGSINPVCNTADFDLAKPEHSLYIEAVK